eukprot:248486_1
MAMTNLNYNHNENTNPAQQLQSNGNLNQQPNPPKQCNASNSPNCHHTNYGGATNLSHLSPIFEGEVFPSPSSNTISPSISANHMDSNHVVLFHSNGNLTPTADNKTPKTPHHLDSASPTTSMSSSPSASSNTPTPTTYNTSNSLFNIPSTNNHPPCIPNVGCMSKTSSIASSSSASASPSPSVTDTTVSPVTKMDLFKDLKIFEDIDTDEHSERFSNNDVTIDYLTGDKHCFNGGRKKKQRNYNDFPSTSQPQTPITPQSPLNSNSLHHNLNNKVPEPLNGKTVSAHKSRKKRHKHRHKHRHHHHRHHSSHRERKNKKKRRRSERNSCSDSDSELQKKGQIRDKIKTISIRVPGDPNGLYKCWKRTKHMAKKMDTTSAHSSLRICAENEETHVTQLQQSLLDLKVKTNKSTNKNRDRLNSYPPNNVIYSIKSPQSFDNDHAQSIPPLIKSSQSCSNLLDKSIIIHAPNKENRDDNKEHHHHYFSVFGMKNYQNKKRNDTKQHGGNMSGGDHESPSSNSNRVRINSYPPYMNYEPVNQATISIERTPTVDDSKDDDAWHYSKHRKQKQIHQQRQMAAKNGITHPGHGGGNNPYLNPYYLTNYHDTKHMHSPLIYEVPWKNDEDGTDTLSEPIHNPSTHTIMRDKRHHSRRRKNLSDHHNHNIHPSMNNKHKMNPQSAKMTGNLVDL